MTLGVVVGQRVHHDGCHLSGRTSGRVERCTENHQQIQGNLPNRGADCSAFHATRLLTDGQQLWLLWIGTSSDVSESRRQALEGREGIPEGPSQYQPTTIEPDP
jgi:hypothetical protein